MENVTFVDQGDRGVDFVISTELRYVDAMKVEKKEMSEKKQLVLRIIMTYPLSASDLCLKPLQT